MNDAVAALKATDLLLAQLDNLSVQAESVEAEWELVESEWELDGYPVCYPVCYPTDFFLNVIDLGHRQLNSFTS